LQSTQIDPLFICDKTKQFLNTEKL
jgi:hypothetical protein